MVLLRGDDTISARRLLYEEGRIERLGGFGCEDLAGSGGMKPMELIERSPPESNFRTHHLDRENDPDRAGRTSCGDRSLVRNAATAKIVFPTYYGGIYLPDQLANLDEQLDAPQWLLPWPWASRQGPMIDTKNVSPIF